jgi:hypothetical protein
MALMARRLKPFYMMPTRKAAIKRYADILQKHFGVPKSEIDTNSKSLMKGELRVDSKIGYSFFVNTIYGLARTNFSIDGEFAHIYFQFNDAPERVKWMHPSASLNPHSHKYNAWAAPKNRDPKNNTALELLDFFEIWAKKVALPRSEWRPVYVMVTALAQEVHAKNQRHKATGRVRTAENKYDKAFGTFSRNAEVRKTKDGYQLRDRAETLLFNLPPNAKDRLFKYR